MITIGLLHEIGLRRVIGVKLDCVSVLDKIRNVFVEPQKLSPECRRDVLVRFAFFDKSFNPLVHRPEAVDLFLLALWQVLYKELSLLLLCEVGVELLYSL